MFRTIFFPWAVVFDLAGELKGAHHDIDRKRAVIRSLMAENEELSAENARLRAHITRFDHDGDGKPGGSRKQKAAPARDMGAEFARQMANPRGVKMSTDGNAANNLYLGKIDQ